MASTMPLLFRLDMAFHPVMALVASWHNLRFLSSSSLFYDFHHLCHSISQLEYVILNIWQALGISTNVIKYRLLTDLANTLEPQPVTYHERD